MTDIRMSQMASGIPYGDNADRPINPATGQPFFNGQENRLEIYTQSVGWQNIVAETPGVISISGQYLESNATSTIEINGTNFSPGATAYAIGTNLVEIEADLTTVNSIVQISAVFSGLSSEYEPYDIKIVNPSNLYGTLPEVLYVNEFAVWSTSSGTLGSFDEKSTISSIQLSATDPESSTILYSVVSGSLPVGLSMNSSGLISGTPSEVTSTTTLNFTVNASDGLNTSNRNFSITINNLPPVWVTSSGNLSNYTKGQSYSYQLSATDTTSISYSVVSGSLPSGLSLSSAGLISGTPDTLLAQTFTVRATNTGGQYVDRSFTINNVGESAPVWSTSSGALPSTASGQSYSYQLSATDDSGSSPAYSLLSGSLPSGLTLSSSGLISGTSSSAGSFTFTVRATDANGTGSDRQFSIFSSSGISATGGSIVTSGDYKYHTFTSSSSFSISSFPSGNVIDVLVVAGGGAGGNDLAGGGGAGGVLYRSAWNIGTGTTSVIVGAGGTDQSTTGNNSSFGSLTAFGGGRGANWNPQNSGQNGGSGGGGGGRSWTAAGSATQTSNNGGTGYGNNGGSGNTASNGPGGGGGGAGAAGESSASTLMKAGDGGIGLNLWSSWAPVAQLGQSGYIAGGGGGADDGGGATVGSGGLGGGANGTSGNSSNAVANTGGGGGASNGYPGGQGGSGIVIVRYVA